MNQKTKWNNEFTKILLFKVKIFLSKRNATPIFFQTWVYHTSTWLYYCINYLEKICLEKIKTSRRYFFHVVLRIIQTFHIRDMIRKTFDLHFKWRLLWCHSDNNVFCSFSRSSNLETEFSQSYDAIVSEGREDLSGNNRESLRFLD